MSDAWKDLERTATKKLGGRRRVARGQDYKISDWDVEVPEFPHWKIDCKYRKASFTIHRMLKEVREKYCDEGDVAIIVSKTAKHHGEVVSMSLDDFSRIAIALKAARPDL